MVKFVQMYTKEEQEFIIYWQKQRLVKTKFFRRILIGLPFGTIIVVAIFLNFFSGWYKRATMDANADPSIFLILLICGILIVAFVAIFASYHRWDRNEQLYQELISRKP